MLLICARRGCCRDSASLAPPFRTAEVADNRLPAESRISRLGTRDEPQSDSGDPSTAPGGPRTETVRSCPASPWILKWSWSPLAITPDIQMGAVEDTVGPAGLAVAAVSLGSVSRTVVTTRSRRSPNLPAALLWTRMKYVAVVWRMVCR